MFSYLYLSLMILGIFSIFENIKGRQKLSIIKLNFLFLLVSITLASAIDFINEFGYQLDFFAAILRIVTTIFIVNLFYLIANNKLPKTLLFLELLIFIAYFIAILYGYRFMKVEQGIYINVMNWISIINSTIINPLIVLSLAFNLNKILRSTDNHNLYQKRIKRWYILLFILFLILLFTTISSIILYLNQIVIKQFDSRIIYIIIRFILTSFIFFRPKFIDEIGFSYNKFSPFLKVGQISVQNFEFLFYINQYFLKSDANLEDFALMLNHSKVEVLDFIKMQTNDSFSELINKNRINYFKDLLKARQHESFTIEALSEMSGFNNRQSMYNAFNKYEGCSPSEYINNI